MTEADTTVVEQILRISARPETVWRYWTDPTRMSEWWGAAADLDPMRGEYVELLPYERLVFSFGWDPTEGGPGIAPGSTLVQITLTADGDDTILALRHTGLPTAAREEHRAGWGRFLPLLGAAASGVTET